MTSKGLEERSLEVCGMAALLVELLQATFDVLIASGEVNLHALNSVCTQYMACDRPR